MMKYLLGLMLALTLTGCGGGPAERIADAVVGACGAGVIDKAEAIENVLADNLIVSGIRAQVRQAVQARGDYDIQLNIADAVIVTCPEK